MTLRRSLLQRQHVSVGEQPVGDLGASHSPQVVCPTNLPPWCERLYRQVYGRLTRMYPTTALTLQYRSISDGRDSVYRLKPQEGEDCSLLLKDGGDAHSVLKGQTVKEAFDIFTLGNEFRVFGILRVCKKKDAVEATLYSNRYGRHISPYYR